MTHSKQCFKCLKTKSIGEFYKHSAMSDGHLGKCKECTKADANRYRADNLERIRECDRQRGGLPHRVKLSVETNRKWRAEDRRRMRCHSAVARALRMGELAPENCEKCGSEKTMAHHDCYDRPLDVRWLCQPCHKQWHKENDYT